MSARTALLTLARRAARAPAQVTRRSMSGGGATIEEEIVEMTKWRTVSFLAIPACAGLAVYMLSSHAHHDKVVQPAYSYLHIRHKIFPWGGDCGLFEYGACEGK